MSDSNYIIRCDTEGEPLYAVTWELEDGSHEFEEWTRDLRDASVMFEDQAAPVIRDIGPDAKLVLVSDETATEEDYS